MDSSGVVDWFSENKGYGYLTAEDGTPVYVQHDQILGEGFRTLVAGQRVRFRLGDDGRGPAAQHVEVVG